MCGPVPIAAPGSSRGDVLSATAPSSRGRNGTAGSRPREARWVGRSRRLIALAAGGLFPPQDRALGLDGTTYSPRVQRKIVSAGVRAESYRAASENLAELSDLGVDPKVIERLVHRIGQERIDGRIKFHTYVVRE